MNYVNKHLLINIRGSVKSLLLALTLLFGLSLMAEENVGEKMNSATNKAVDSVKESYRNTKDKTCEMINGKMQCVAKKIKNKFNTATDKTKTKVQEVKDKID